MGYQSHFHVPISLQITFNLLVSVQISLAMSTEDLSYSHFPIFPLAIRVAMIKITFPTAVLSGPFAAMNIMTSFVYHHR